MTSLAGPMIAAVVVLPENHGLTFLPIDSKRLGKARVLQFASFIRKTSLFVEYCIAPPSRVEEVGQKQARQEIWLGCAQKVRRQFPGISIVVDGKDPIEGVQGQRAVTHGDAHVDEVSAAAIVATRQLIRIMGRLERQYPQYRFSRHLGTPNVGHLREITTYGLSPVHRQNAVGAYMRAVHEQELIGSWPPEVLYAMTAECLALRNRVPTRPYVSQLQAVKSSLERGLMPPMRMRRWLARRYQEIVTKTELIPMEVP